MRKSHWIAGLIGCTFIAQTLAAPNISNDSLRGLQIGGKTKIVLQGSDLLPNPVVIASFAISSQTVLPNAQPNRVEIELELPATVAPGIQQLRIASGKGVSNAVVIGLDRLPQQPFGVEVTSLPVAFHGTLTGTQVLATKFRGVKGQKFVADLEARRLGGKLKPVLRVKDHRGRQIAYSPGLPSIAGDARIAITLPEDGEYAVEFQDVLFRGAGPGYFRLKLGDLQFADLAYPLGVQIGSKATPHFSLTNLGTDVTAEVDASALRQPADLFVPMTAIPSFSGSAPRIIASVLPELVESMPPGGGRQELAAAPVAVTARLSHPGEEDQFLVPVKPGARLRIEVFAQQLGSRLDGVLSVRNEAGQQLSGNDDRPGQADPAVDFNVSDGMNKLVVAVTDLLKRGGDEFVYRIAVTDLAVPTFSVIAESDRVNVPAEATQTIRVQVNRAGYNGPIRLTAANFPDNIAVAGHEIPADATIGLVTLTAAAGSPTASLVQVVAQASDNSAIASLVRVPETDVSQSSPWLRSEMAFAVTEPTPVRIAWAGPNDSPMLLGDKFPLTVAITRADGAPGNLKLRLLTTQVMPRRKVKENNQDKEVDDLDRALRLDGEPMLDANAKQGTVNMLVPADLAAQDWSLVLAADLLAADNKTVVSTTTTTVFSKRPTAPFNIEIAGTPEIEAKAGLGDTGKVSGKVRRQTGFAQPVSLKLLGLPKEYTVPTVIVPGDKEDFEFTVRFPFGVKPAELKDGKLIGEFLPNDKRPELLVKSAESAVGLIKVVAGEPPPPTPALQIFEDDEKFVGLLTKGSGLITLDTQDKYSGTAAAKVTPDQRYEEMIPTLNVRIRENPGPGEYRYLRFAWKKKGGKAICLQLNHDGTFGPGGSGKEGAKFRYHAGPGDECFGASLLVSDKLPVRFEVVTRDLFADFGEFTLSGLAFGAMDGNFAHFDHLYLGASIAELDKVKPAKPAK